MGRVLDVFIVIVTMTVALFGLGVGSYIYVQLPPNALGPLLVVLSAVGGFFGVVKLLRMWSRSTRSSSSHTGPHGPLL
jgi:hypothetical protein